MNRLHYPPRQNQTAETMHLKEGQEAIRNKIGGKFVVLHLRFDKVIFSSTINVLQGVIFILL